MHRIKNNRAGEEKMRFQYKRLVGYIAGFMLFYAPFAFFQKVVYYLYTGKWSEWTVHHFCLRIQLEHILDRSILDAAFISTSFLLLLLAAAFLCGPFFCGRLCPAGALTEYLSKLLPPRWQIQWENYVEIAPLRYGMLAGYVLLPFLGAMLACAYCNFYIFDLLLNFVSRGYLVSLSSSMLLTAFLMLVVFGLFTRGGRGYCNFLCPVGAVQNLVYWLGRKLPFVSALQIDRQRCIGCGKCARSCPMRSMKIQDKKAAYNVHNCILCGVCTEVCPVDAIHYGRKKEGEGV